VFPNRPMAKHANPPSVRESGKDSGCFGKEVEVRVKQQKGGSYQTTQLSKAPGKSTFPKFLFIGQGDKRKSRGKGWKSINIIVKLRKKLPFQCMIFEKLRCQAQRNRVQYQICWRAA